MKSIIKFLFILTIFSSIILNEKKCIAINPENIPAKFFVKDSTEVLKSGTGFYVHFDSKLFFVTARHNIIDSTDSLLGNAFTVDIWCDYPQYMKRSYSFRAPQLTNTIRIRKIFDNSVFDIAVLYIGEYIPNPYIFSFNLEKEYCPIDSINPMQEIVLVGFPFSLIEHEQYDDFRPVIRKGIVSNVYIKENYIISDILSTTGDSGSPVITLGNNYLCGVLIKSINKKNHLGFAGIISASIVHGMVKKLNEGLNENN